MTQQICGDDDPEYIDKIIELMANVRPSRVYKLQDETAFDPEAFEKLAEEVLREPVESLYRAEAELRAAEDDFRSLIGLPPDLR
ncbi:MAG TPA: hypothetical protein VL220_01265 [Steroidobacteraceae bacterium]|nr:hypothetical protein [Steroidobacteraceae bacterium]